MIGSALWAVASYSAHLFFDTGLQVFYIGMSAYGIYNWNKGSQNEKELPISTYSLYVHVRIVLVGLSVSGFLIYLSQNSSIIQLPILDAITTVFLVIGTILLVQRKLFSWLYLVAADVVYLYIYGQSGLWLFVGVMVIYIVFGIVGYRAWNKAMLSTD